MPIIPLFKVYMSEIAPDIVGETLMSGMITQGKKVEEFEDRLKKFFDWPWVLTLNSATSGLCLANRLLGVTEQDEVISTPLTCFATTCGIIPHTRKIVWADTDSSTCNIDLDDVKKKLTKDTKVLSFVHWGGVPVNIDKVIEVQAYAKETFGNDLHVVQDCAHAFGAKWNGRSLGTHSQPCGIGHHIAVYSLQAIKHLTTGDGGVIILPNEELYHRAKILRWYGIDRDRRSLPGTDFRLEPDVPEAGYKFHMNDITASIGLSNFYGLEYRLDKYRDNAEYYGRELCGLDIVELFPVEDRAVSSYWIYTLKIKNGLKKKFIDFMTTGDVMVSQVHARNDKHTCVMDCVTFLPELDQLESEIVSIPSGWWVGEDERKYIVSRIIMFDSTMTPDPPERSIVPLRVEDCDEYKSLLVHLNGHVGEPSPVFSTEGTYVVKVGRKIVAAATLIVIHRMYDPIGHIEDVVTHPAYRHRGHGKALIQRLTAFAVEKGCYKVVLSCADEVQPFYTSCGYNREGALMTSRK